MVSLGRDTSGLGPLQSSDCKTVNGRGAAVALWHLGHSLFQCPGCLQRAHWSQSSLHCLCPHRVHWPCGPCGLPGPDWPRKAASPLVVFEQTKPLQSCGPFAYFSGCVQAFWPYPYYWKPNKPIGTNHSLIGVWGPAVAFWVLCLMSGADWAMKCIAKRACTPGEEGSTFIRDPWPCRVSQFKCPLCPS